MSEPQKLCSKCDEKPRLPRQRYCQECRNSYARAWNAKQSARMKAMEEELARLRAQLRAHEERGILGQ